MKRRNEFLKYGRMFDLDTGAGGTSRSDNQDDVDNNEIDDIIDEEKEKFDVKKILEQQQEQIKQQQEKYDLLLAKLEKTKEKSSKEKPNYLTAEEVEAIYDKKDKERRVTEKLSNYGITGERLDKLKGLPPESLEAVLDTLKEKATLPNTRKIGGGKSSPSKTIMTIDDILNEL